MDVDERTLALSELVLPTLSNSSLSTPRLEELIWHRLMIGGSDIDVMSQVHLARLQWPKESSASKLHASKRADFFLKVGHLITDNSSTG